jgi:hypothetical protein
MEPAPVRRIPLTLQTLYADLVQQVASSHLRAGSVYRRTLKGIAYLYVKVPVGQDRHDRFLGRADDPQVQAQVAAIADETARTQERRQTVRMLRARDIPGPTPDLGRVLDALAYADLFHRGAVLVGTAAYQCYAPLVGAYLPSASLMTQDADLAAASLAISASEQESLETVLKRADRTFAPIPGLKPKAPPWRFRSASGFLVDLLTPQLRRTDSTPMPIPHLGAGAVPLQHLSWLIQDPVGAVALFGAGIPVTVPQPARYAVHKLIIAQKRASDAAKRRKDLLQAHALVEAMLQEDPYAVSDAIADARSRGAAGWAQPIQRSLTELGLTDRLPTDA